MHFWRFLFLIFYLRYKNFFTFFFFLVLSEENGNYLRAPQTSPIENFIPWNTSLSILRAVSPVEHSLNKPAYVIKSHLSPCHRCVRNSWFCAQVWAPVQTLVPNEYKRSASCDCGSKWRQQHAANEGSSMPAQRNKYSAQGSIINWEWERKQNSRFQIACQFQ